MKIDDDFYYRKNILANYMMSEALAKHREILKGENKLRINDFIFPLLSAVVSMATAYYSEDFNLNSIQRIILIITVFLVFYYFISKIFILIFDKIIYAFNYLFVIPKKKQSISDLCYKFNYNIVNQIYYSYSLINDFKNEDVYLKKYNIYESFINFENSITSLKDVFNKNTIEILNKNEFSGIYKFRIELFFSILKIIYDNLYKSEEAYKMEIELENLRISYNTIVKNLNQTGKVYIEEIL